MSFTLFPVDSYLLPVDSSLLSIDSTSCKLSQQLVSQHLSCLCLFMGQCHPSPRTQKPSHWSPCFQHSARPDIRESSGSGRFPGKGNGHLPGAVVGDPIHDEVMRKRPDRQGCSGYKGPSRLAPASTPPCILPPFLLLFLFALLRILVLPAESSPAPLSLNEDQLKTLINKYPGRWYPLKGLGMKEMLHFKPFCWHSGLFDKCGLPLQKMLMIVLNILSTVH